MQNTIYRFYSRIILGLGNASYGSKHVAGAVRRGILRLEFVHVLLIGVLIVTILRAYLRLRLGIDVPKNYAIGATLLVYVAHLPILARLAIAAVKYHHKYRTSSETLNKLRLRALGLYFGSPFIALLLILAGAYLII